MLTLSVIAGATLTAVVLIALHAKHRYQTAVATIRGENETRRQAILRDDAANDDRFVESLAGTQRTLAQLLPEYTNIRAELLPGARCEPVGWWGIHDLNGWLRTTLYAGAKSVGERLLYQSAALIVVVVTVAAGLAAWRYHALSQSPAAAAAASPSSDSLSQLPDIVAPASESNPPVKDNTHVP